VLEHIKDEVEFLGSALFHLKKGGIVFVDVPALQMFKSKYDDAVGHLRRYDKRSLRTLLERAGLHILDMRYWGFSMLPLLAARKVMLGMGTRSPSQIIEKGAKPRGKLFEICIRSMMKTELALIKHPPLGTSVLAVALKDG
jgi:hypothetical protein